MGADLEKALQTEKEKRKEVARKRTFWFLFVFNFALIAYICIQFIILFGAK